MTASKTRLSKSGQPTMGTVLRVGTWDIDLNDGTPRQPDSWETVTVVGKLYGKGGNADLIGLIVQFDDGSRQRTDWPCEAWEPIG